MMLQFNSMPTSVNTTWWGPASQEVTQFILCWQKTSLLQYLVHRDWRFTPHRIRDTYIVRLHNIQRKVRSGMNMNSRAVFILFQQSVELFGKKTPHDSRLSRKQTFPWGQQLWAELDQQSMKWQRLERWKPLVPHKLKSILWEDIYVGLSYAFLISSTTGTTKQ